MVETTLKTMLVADFGGTWCRFRVYNNENTLLEGKYKYKDITKVL